MDLSIMTAVIALLSGTLIGGWQIYLGHLQLGKSKYANDKVFLQIRPTGVLESILRQRQLRVGCLWYPPFIEYMRQEKVTATGLYPMMLEELAKREDLAIQYTILRWDRAIEAVAKREVDLVVCVLQSGKRRDSCDFVGTLYRVGVSGVALASNPKIKGHEALARPDVTIAVTKGEIGWEYALKYLSLEHEIERFSVLEHTQITTMMDLVITGKVDIALADSLSCAQYLRSEVATKVGAIDPFVRMPLHIEDNSLMIAKDQLDLKEWLSEKLKEIRQIQTIVEEERHIAREYDGILIRTGSI